MARTRPPALVTCSLLLALSAPGLARAAPLGLSDFEAGLVAQDEYRIAETDLALADAVAQREAGNAGLRANGAVGGGALYEPQYLGGARDYGSISLSMGLRYPILGSAAEERLRVASARLDALVAEARRDGERTQLLRALRESFFAYAHACALEELARAFLSDAGHIRDVLRRRQAAGLVLEGDRRQLEAAFALAERELRTATEERRLRGEELRRWRRDFEGEILVAAPSVVRVTDGDATRRASPLPEAAVSSQLSAIELALPRSATGARGSLFVNGTVRRDSDLGNGGGVIAGIALDWPLSSDALTGLSRERDARLERARLVLARAREEERTAAERALASAERSASGWRLARVRVAASGASLIAAARRAALARGADGAPIERWLGARAELFRELVDLLEAEHQQALAAALLELALGGPGPIAVARSAPVECRQAATALLAWQTLEAGLPGAGPPPCAEGEAVRTGQRAYYAWDGERALARAADEGFWRGTGASELWISFSGEEVARLRQPAARAALRTAIAALRRRAQRVVLLLGEPTWLRPGQEERLTAILQEFSDVPFDAIHLDVEPGQLAPALPPEQAWPALAALVRRTREVAHRPVIVSLNWRDLWPDQAGGCRGSAAAHAADEVAVMLYATSPAVVAERMRTILAARPAQRVWLVQSIESAGGADESFATRGRAALDGQLDRLADLAREPAFAGFAVQSLEDFLEARP